MRSNAAENAAIVGVGAGRAGGGGGAEPGLSARDLAELLGAFNESSRRLQESHEVLRAEVSRLKAELKDANEQLERSRRLAALGEMAAGIAHEVRNPLGSIRLYAKMLGDDLVDRPRERRVAEKIGVAVSGLDAVVGDVLAFAREMCVRAESRGAGEVIDAALEEVLACERGMGASGRVPRVVRCDGDGEAECPRIECDAVLAHRALTNIVRNAMDAMREHGAVAAQDDAESVLVIGAERKWSLDADGTKRLWASVVVRDTGGGVPAEAMQRVFNPFFTTRATGTGLGLAIVHRIMDAHGGRIVLRNVEAGTVGSVKLGRGAQVELLFPADGEMDRGSVGVERGGAMVEVKSMEREGQPAGRV